MYVIAKPKEKCELQAKSFMTPTWNEYCFVGNSERITNFIEIEMICFLYLIFYFHLCLKNTVCGVCGLRSPSFDSSSVHSGRIVSCPVQPRACHWDCVFDTISVACSEHAGQLAALGVASVWSSWVRSPPGPRYLSVPLWVYVFPCAS